MNLILKIDKPCKESLDRMNDVDGGKFCSTCSKKVLDFSQFQGSEIKKIFHKNKGERICGILSKNHLHKAISENISSPEIPLKRIRSFTKITAGLALTASIINLYPAQSAKPHTPEVSITTNTVKKQKVKEPHKDDGNTIIRGKVINKNTGKLVADVTVKLITFQKVYKGITDKDGFYSLEIPNTAIREENLIEFKPFTETLSTELVTFKKEEILKKNITHLSENTIYAEYGEVSEVWPYQNSIIVLEGKKVDYKIFNKSYLLFHDRYEVYYIPKPYTRAFTNNEKIQDIFIAFIK